MLPMIINMVTLQRTWFCSELLTRMRIGEVSEGIMVRENAYVCMWRGAGENAKTFL